MPAFLDPGDRRILIGAAIVLVVLLGLSYALAPAPTQQSIGYPSSYSTDWGGAKAAFLLLKDLGYDTERWEDSPDRLPTDETGNTVLILAEPFEAESSDDLTAIRRFVSVGGRVIGTGATAAKILPDAGANAVPDWDPRGKPYEAMLPSPLTRGAPEITMVAPDEWTAHATAQLAVYGAQDKPVVLTYRVGRGEVIWWASASPLTNGSIQEKSNLALLLNCVGVQSTRVLWDEYFHGARASLFSYFAETPLPWAALQAGLIFLAVLFTYSRRAGPIYVPAGEPRLSPIEFVETLGDLYQSAHASPAAVGVAYQRFRMSLSRKLGVPTKAKIPELCRAASARFGWPEPELLDTLARSERAMRGLSLDEKEALELVRRLHEYSAQLEGQRKTEQETRGWK